MRPAITFFNIQLSNSRDWSTTSTQNSTITIRAIYEPFALNHNFAGKNSIIGL